MGAFTQFIANNSSLLINVENALRSLSYVIPGRFQDSEFAAEVLYSAVNLLRLMNDALHRGSDMDGDLGLGSRARNAYLQYLCAQSPVMKKLITFLNVAWTVEVPMEMLIQRMLGISAKYRFLIVAEVLKACVRAVIFFGGRLRPLLSNFLPDGMGRLTADDIAALTSKSKGYRQAGEGDTDYLAEVVSEIKLSMEETGKGKDAIKAFLQKHRLDAPVLVPELSVTPLQSTVAQLRELVHIFRPAIYTILMAISLNRQLGKKVQWSAWIISLSMDLFSEWSTLMAIIGDSSTISDRPLVEKTERQTRIFKLFLYLLREPFYNSFSKEFLDGLADSASSWKLLAPLVQTGKSYQGLCEKVFYYTLGS